MKVKARLTYLPYLLNSMGLNAYGFFFFALFNNAITFNVNNRAYQLQKKNEKKIWSNRKWSLWTIAFRQFVTSSSSKQSGWDDDGDKRW